MFTWMRLTITFILTLPFVAPLFVYRYLDLDEIAYLNKDSVSLSTIVRDVKILWNSLNQTHCDGLIKKYSQEGAIVTNK